ncbi:MAG: transporter substrate-binding domain-containing protein [Ancalomicrobiaceae bacterium]|nr:transporter substrate-binding domain-containing protein [Ancalomicrobiaceae bacterium]
MMRMLVAAALCLISVGAGLAAPAPKEREWKLIRFAVEGIRPPLNYRDAKGDLQGFDVELARALCERLHAACEFVHLDGEAQISELLAKKIDAVAGLTVTEERRKRVDFTDRTYALSPRFVASRSSVVTEASPEALKGRVVGAQLGTAYATYLNEVYAPKGVNVKLYVAADDVTGQLAAGRLDAVLADPVALYQWVDKGRGHACCRFIGNDVKGAKYFGDGTAIAIRREDNDLRLALNKALADILRDGSFERLNARFLPFALY